MSDQEKYELFLKRVTPEALAKFLYMSFKAKSCIPSVFTRSKYISDSLLAAVIRVSDHPYPSSPDFEGVNIVVLPEQKGIMLDGEMLPLPKKLTSHISVMHGVKKAIRIKYADIIAPYHPPAKKKKKSFTPRFDKK